MSDTTYTDSAKLDKIADVLNSDKYTDLVYSLRGNPKGPLEFNPLASEHTTNIYLLEPEEFPLLVKAAIVRILAPYDDELEKRLLNSLKIIITSEDEIKFNTWSSKFEGIPKTAKCQVIGAYKMETYTKTAEAYCPKCGRRDKVRTLSVIPDCTNKDCERKGHEMFLDQSSVRTGDIRTILLQEPVDEVKLGSPTTFECIVKDDLVFNTYIGQRKRLTAVLRSTPQRNKDTNRILLNTVSLVDLEDDNLLMPTDSQIEKFREIVKNQEFIEIITRSYAPHIKFRKLEKLCILIGRVGSTKVDGISGNIHVFLTGNPSTAKSKLLEYLQEVTQRSGFAVGGTSSGSGITAAMFTLANRQKIVKSGIVPQCSGSTVAIDEFNQLEAEDMSKLNECMASQMIHYNKGGIEADLIADTTIIAGANPKGFTYKENFGMVNNLNIPLPLVSRFGLIVNVLPYKDKGERDAILDHIKLIDEIGISDYVKKNGLLSKEDMKLFLNYAKHLRPKMTIEAKKLVDDFYKLMDDLDSSDQQKDGAKKIDMRFYHTVLNTSKAYAKLHLSDIVTPEFAQTAIEIIKSTLRTFGLKTENQIEQLSMKEAEIDKETAILEIFRELDGRDQTDYHEESEIIKLLHEKYPKFFKTPKRAEDFFQETHRLGKLDKKEGKYKYV